MNQPLVCQQQDSAVQSSLNQLRSRCTEFCQSHKFYFCDQIPDCYESIREDRIFYFWFGDQYDLNDWINFDNELTLNNKKAIAITDSIVEHANFDSLTLISCPELLGVHSHYAPAGDQLLTYSPSKLFNCFIHRVDSVRQSWFYFLHLHNLLDQGYVSFLLFQLSQFGRLSGIDLFEHIHYSFDLNQLPHFDRAYHDLKSLVPYQNFTEINDIVPYIIDSKYSLVLDGDATEDDTGSYLFTEKVCRSLQYPGYNLLFVQKGGINQLKQLGFELNLDLDSIDDLPWQQRQKKLLDVLIGDPADIDLKFQVEVANHNQNLLKSWASIILSPEYLDDFFDRAMQL